MFSQHLDSIGWEKQLIQARLNRFWVDIDSVLQRGIKVNEFLALKLDGESRAKFVSDFIEIKNQAEEYILE